MKELVRLSLKGMRMNLAPGLALQVVALFVVGSFYFWPASLGFFQTVESLKLDYGYAYSAVTTGVFGGLIPFAYLAFVGWEGRSQFLGTALFFLGFWTWKGVEVDFLYRMQGVFFGEGTDAWTVVKKVVFDQFIYCPIWSAPTTALAYRWKDCGFSWKRMKASIDRKLFTQEIPSVLVSIWMVWIPGTAFVYSMPSALQLPLFTLVLCFYVLLVSVLNDAGKGEGRGVKVETEAVRS